MTKLVQYEIHQEVQTATGANNVLLMTNTAPDPTPEGLARYEKLLAPRIRKYEEWGTIIVIRQTWEEVKL
ncbi:MAG TPA: hypothetical protein PLG27_09830 [Candidatus Latescibacteria bacterium]|nr:hypothetical protein [Candidatus Latescibacterota bacterium]